MFDIADDIETDTILDLYESWFLKDGEDAGPMADNRPVLTVDGHQIYPAPSSFNVSSHSPDWSIAPSWAMWAVVLELPLFWVFSEDKPRMIKKEMVITSPVDYSVTQILIGKVEPFTIARRPM